MIRLLLSVAALAATFAGAAPASTFRAPAIQPAALVQLDAPLSKSAAAAEIPGGRMRVGDVRALPKAAAVAQWTPAAGGFVARFTASSAEARGLRVKLDLGAVPGAIEARVRGGDGRIETLVVDPMNGPEAWTPWTEGPTQVVELFSAVRPSREAVRVGAVLHFDVSPFAKAAGECTVSTSCTTNNAALDAAIAEAKNSVIKISFVDGGSGFVCSATLIDTPRYPAAFVLTANHCIDNVPSAGSITSWWFYESAACDAASAVDPAFVQVAGGMELVYPSYPVDTTLLLLRQAPPAGAAYAAIDPAYLGNGAPIVSLSHPAGDTRRLALGNTTNPYRIFGYPHNMYGVAFTRGIIQGGSSGSGLFTQSAATGRLALRGVLSGTTIRQAGGMSCTNLTEEALYGRLEMLYPQIEPYIGATATRAADDAPNRAIDMFASPDIDTPLDQRGSTLAIDNLRIDYPGDVDLFRFRLLAPAYVSAWTEGANLDTVGSFLDGRGAGIDSEDDVQAGDNHFGMTKRLAAGTYFVQVGHYEPRGTGSYNLRLRADAVGTNYTDLWWNAAESGWGLNVNHQGDKLFTSLFTYENGAPMWLVMSDGSKQSDGSYAGTLFRQRGAPFNQAWRAPTSTAVGTMRLAFTSAGAGTLTYTYNGVTVTKSITRDVYSTPPACTWSAFDRSLADNYQDLWWNPAEPGWGLNVSHQGDILFVSIFTYDGSGRDLWLVMSEGRKIGGSSYSGPLYRMAGPALDANPWTPATPTQVGTMSLNFAAGNANSATLTYSVNGQGVTKSIQRFTFGMPRTECAS